MVQPPTVVSNVAPLPTKPSDEGWQTRWQRAMGPPESWTAAHPSPIPLPEIDRMIRDLAPMLEPAPVKLIAVKLVETMRVFGLPEGWDRGTAKFYIEALEDVPTELIEPTLKAVRLNCKFTPKPAEIRQNIPAVWSHRRYDMHRLLAIRARARRDEEDRQRGSLTYGKAYGQLTPAQREQHAEAMTRFREQFPDRPRQPSARRVRASYLRDSARSGADGETT